MTLTQTSSTLAGTITLNTACIATASVTGTVSGTTINFGHVTGGSQTVSFDGSFTASSMHGSYHSSATCGADSGTWQATRS
jgi:hypothetical protein